MKITLFPIKGLMLVNRKGRFTPVTLSVAVSLWLAGIASPDTTAARSLMQGFYTCGEA